MFEDDSANDEYQDDVEHEVDNEVIDDEQDADDADEQDGQDEAADGQDDTLDYSFDDGDDDKDDFAGKPAPEWVKQVRQENRELKRQLKQRESQQEQQQVLREKPTLDAHDYEEDSYQADLEQWFVEKQQHDVKVQAEAQKYQQYHERYRSDVDAVRAVKPDYDAAETVVVETLSENKQHLLQMLVHNPAKVVYVLGKNSPEQLEKMANLDDIQFAREIVLMEQSMSTVKRNPNKPKPKSHSLEGMAGGGDTKLAKLEAEAAKTGDRSKIHAYNRSKK